MKFFFNRLYVVSAVLVFAATFFMLLPAFIVGMYISCFSRHVLRLNYWWARVFFALIGLPVRCEWRFRPAKGQQYIFCANHFSLMDIPVMGLVKPPAVFVGKSSIARAPVFGWMFRRLHIAVNRASIKSGAEAIRRSAVALDEGKSLIIFPEGGIKSHCPPLMAAFRDGAFRLAIEKQVPVVPVTLPYNWFIFPDDGRHLIRLKRPKIILHPPIATASMTMEQLQALKEMCFFEIENELRLHFPLAFAEKASINC